MLNHLSWVTPLPHLNVQFHTSVLPSFVRGSFDCYDLEDDSTVFMAFSMFWKPNLTCLVQEMQCVDIALSKLELLVKESEMTDSAESGRLRADLDKIRSLKQDVEVYKASLKSKAAAKEIRIVELEVGDVTWGAIVVFSSSISHDGRLLIVLMSISSHPGLKPWFESIQLNFVLIWFHIGLLGWFQMLSRRWIIVGTIKFAIREPL